MPRCYFHGARAERRLWESTRKITQYSDHINDGMGRPAIRILYTNPHSRHFAGAAAGKFHSGFIYTLIHAARESLDAPLNRRDNNPADYGSVLVSTG